MATAAAINRLLIKPRPARAAAPHIQSTANAHQPVRLRRTRSQRIVKHSHDRRTEYAAKTAPTSQTGTKQLEPAQAGPYPDHSEDLYGIQIGLTGGWQR
jgi:hypothetical protein